MIRTWPALTVAVFGLFQVDLRSAQAQMSVTGALSSVVEPATPKADRAIGLDRRRPWRDRNRYYAARPVDPPSRPGARANVTLEPFTSKYYPTANSYYPPLPVVPPARLR